MSPALVLTRPPLSQVQFCCNLCLHQSLMGLRASLKNFLSSHQTPFTLFLSKPSASPHTTSQYGIPLYFRCLGFIMGFIFCKDKKTLTALEGMSETNHTCLFCTHVCRYTDGEENEHNLPLLFYCWWATVGFIASNHDWCSNSPFASYWPLICFVFSLCPSLSLIELSRFTPLSHFNLWQNTIWEIVDNGCKENAHIHTYSCVCKKIK